MLEIHNTFFNDLQTVEPDDLYKNIMDRNLDVKKIYSEMKL